MGPSTNESPKGQYCDPKVQEGLGDALNKRFLHSSNLNYVSTGAQEDVAPIVRQIYIYLRVTRSAEAQELFDEPNARRRLKRATRDSLNSL